MSSVTTVYPGMPASDNENQVSGVSSQNTRVGAQGNKSKAIMGFLYSVSRTAYGEYWPLYVGPNTIGKGPNSSICLKETSVSESHATIVIRMMQKNGESDGVFVFIQDTGSTYGTMLNGVTLDFNPKECKNGDIITIGANYELYFIAIDPNALGLAPKSDFKPSETKPDSGWTQNSGANPSVNEQFGPKGTNPGIGQSPFDSSRKTTMYMPNKKR